MSLADPPRDPRSARGSVAALAVVAALIGGGAAAALLAVTGAVGGDESTTVVQRVTSTVARAGAPSIDARAVYAGAAAGAVDITARGTTTSAGPAPGPFGGRPPQSETTATGSGFLTDAAGHVVTASHVVSGASSVTIRLQDGTSRKATVLGSDDATDVAVLKIDPSGLTLHPLRLGSSAALGVGAAVAAIGDPFTYERSISTGIVSGLDRTIEAPNGFTVAHAIQTDAALNPGNSGGPLLDGAGRVVGVVDQIATSGSSEQSSGVGFAVPIDLVASELGRLQRGEKIRHAYLGVSTSTATGTTAGAVAGEVTAGGPAARAGLQAGDVITAVDGTTVKGSNDVVAAVAAHDPGDQVTLTVRRGDQTRRLTVTLGTQPAQSSASTG